MREGTQPVKLELPHRGQTVSMAQADEVSSFSILFSNVPKMVPQGSGGFQATEPMRKPFAAGQFEES